MRAPSVRASYALPGELTFDFFAGGGGASTGIESALERPVDIAINHDPVAIAMHKANHPETKHFCENVWEVDPLEATGGRPVGLAWFSPDCTHFSRAKGTTPRKKEIRGLAWVVVRWAKTVRPRVLIVENVEEFATWGPLDENGHPQRERAGETFREWIAALTDLGYQVEQRTLVAADYGAPTTRRRLFLVARCDGQPIVWPDATHGKGRAQPWRAAAEVIDWSLPCPSIFDRKRPLAEATLRRIAKGIERYVLGSASPFIVPLTHQGDSRVHGIDEPVRTVTGAHRGELALIEPFVVRHGHYSTLTGAGLREGCGAGTFRGQPLSTPLATVCATNDKHLVCPIITKHYGDPDRASGGGAVVGHRVDRALGTVTARDHHALTAAFLTKLYGTSHSASVQLPLPTVTAGGGKGGGHLAEVRAFLVKYYGAEGRDSAQQVLEPLHTVTSKARFGLVMVAGEPYQIVDIGMRMLQPHELFAAQGFPADYDITTGPNGKPLTKTEQIALCGNSVCPPQSAAIVAANTARPEAVAS
ncbi:MAG TPA: DNA cytosine methyltransferase [Polyangiales bacterium]|jgi:DNA (cytosine-5)-methyltransferase 1|nr:DNA cytosine methyltransferase [Polyangiales bacterium]